MKGKPISKTVANFYDNAHVNHYFQEIWGGEDLHIGIYQKDKMDIIDASVATTEKMLKLIPKLKKSSKILDIGSGYGGAARYIVNNFGSNVTCLNISEVQNEISQKKNKKGELDDDIVVMQGNMEKLPFPRESFDLVWSQDALMHSAHREKVFREVSRVLDAEGRFIYTDIYLREDPPADLLDKILAHLQLKDLATIVKYDRLARKVDLEKVYNRDFTENLLIQYKKVLEVVIDSKSKMEKNTTKTFVQDLIKGLEAWVQGIEDGYLGWGILQYQKRNSWM